jgi:hypothetical protein
MHKDPLERELEFRKSIEQAALARRESHPARRLFRWLTSFVPTLARRTVTVLAIAIPILFVGLFVVIFGIAVKWTDAYACSMAVASRSPTVLREIGEPLEPGFFVWSFSYIREASVTDASFRTALAGPQGSGTLKVHLYSSPLGSSLNIDLEKNGQTYIVHRGPAQCR